MCGDCHECVCVCVSVELDSHERVRGIHSLSDRDRLAQPSVTRVPHSTVERSTATLVSLTVALDCQSSASSCAPRRMWLTGTSITPLAINDTLVALTVALDCHTRPLIAVSYRPVTD